MLPRYRPAPGHGHYPPRSAPVRSTYSDTNSDHSACPPRPNEANPSAAIQSSPRQRKLGPSPSHLALRAAITRPRWGFVWLLALAPYPVYSCAYDPRMSIGIEIWVGCAVPSWHRTVATTGRPTAPCRVGVLCWVGLGWIVLDCVGLCWILLG